MNDWFTVDRIDADTHIISEYRHWEETKLLTLTDSVLGKLRNISHTEYAEFDLFPDFDVETESQS